MEIGDKSNSPLRSNARASAKPLAIGCTHARDDAPGRRIDHVAARIHRDERRHDQPVRPDDRRAAEARFHRAVVARDLPHRRARAGADGAFGHGSAEAVRAA